LQRKIAEGALPNGCLLPLNDFMMVFKLRLAGILKAVFELERQGFARIVEKARAKDVGGKDAGQPKGIDVREDL
jgi:hypothetical protein